MGERLHSEILFESDSLFTNTFIYAPIGKALNSCSGEFIKVNQAYCDFIGYSEEELRSKDFLTITHPEHVSMGLEYCQKLLRGKINSFQIEKRYIHKDGRTLWGWLSRSSIQDGLGNRLLIAQVIDITKRKEMEQELAATKERLESFIQNTSDGIAVCDLEGRVLQVNPAFERIFGWSEQEIKGKSLPPAPM